MMVDQDHWFGAASWTGWKGQLTMPGPGLLVPLPVEVEVGLGPTTNVTCGTKREPRLSEEKVQQSREPCSNLPAQVDGNLDANISRYIHRHMCMYRYTHKLEECMNTCSYICVCKHTVLDSACEYVQVQVSSNASSMGHLFDDSQYKECQMSTHYVIESSHSVMV